MREKRQKRATVVNTSSKDVEKSATATSRQKPATANSSTDVPKRKSYKFTPIVFDLDSSKSEKLNAGSTTEQTKWKSFDSHVNPGSSGVQGRRLLSIPKAAEAATDYTVAASDVSATAEQPVLSKSDPTTEVADSLSDKSEGRITPVIKRQLSSSNPPSDAKKKRRTSSDSR